MNKKSKWVTKFHLLTAFKFTEKGHNVTKATLLLFFIYKKS